MINEEKTEKMKNLLDLLANPRPSDVELAQIDEIAKSVGNRELLEEYFSASSKAIKFDYLGREIESTIIRVFGEERGPNHRIPSY